MRRARPDDAEAIASVHVRSWQQAYRGQVPDEYLAGLDITTRAGWWRRELEVTPAERSPWLADSDAGVAGFVASGPTRDEGGSGRTAEIQAIYVDPDCWNRGIGRDLLSHAERDLSTAGYDEAILWCLIGNQQARRFYEAAGWRTDGGTQTITLGGRELEEVRYRLDFRRRVPQPAKGGLQAGPTRFSPGRRTRSDPPTR